MPVRVLIVDDQASFRSAALELLESRGYAVVDEATCTATALDAVERSRPDAVLLDVRLHRENGFDVSRVLTRACPALAVLLVSGEDYRDCEDLMEYSGARGFALKSELAATDLARYWPDPAA